MLLLLLGLRLCFGLLVIKIFLLLMLCLRDFRLEVRIANFDFCFSFSFYFRNKNVKQCIRLIYPLNLLFRQLISLISRKRFPCFHVVWFNNGLLYLCLFLFDCQILFRLFTNFFANLKQILTCLFVLDSFSLLCTGYSSSVFLILYFWLYFLTWWLVWQQLGDTWFRLWIPEVSTGPNIYVFV